MIVPEHQPRRLAATFLAFLLLSCAGPRLAELPRSPLPDDCWLLQPHIYRLRQSARLEYQDRVEMLEGFMELDLSRNRAHLVIFSTLGLTLLNIEIERHQYQLAETVTEAGKNLTPNFRKQQFAATVATAVQHVFLSLEDYHSNHHAGDQQPLAESSGTPPRLTKISESRQKPAWSVTYDDYHKGPAGWLPGRITLQNHNPDYRLTLWLHKAKLLTGN